MIEDSDKWDQVKGFISQWSEVCKNSMKKLSKILRKGGICSRNGVVPLFQGQTFGENDLAMCGSTF